MDVLWDNSEPMPAGSVHDSLTSERSVSYTTVLTVLVRLWRKGRLERELLGRAHVYRPILSREEHIAEEMHKLLDEVANPSSALSHFVAALDGRQTDQLRSVLKRHRGQ